MSTTHTLPAFSTIDPSTIVEKLDALLAHNRQRIAECLAQQTTPSWDSLYLPLDELEESLTQFWSPISHLHAVKSDEALREAYKACLPKLSDYYTELGHNRELYHAIKRLRDSESYDALSPARKKIIHDDLRDFHLSGIDLAPDEQQRFKAIQTALSEISNRFEEHVLDATDAWHKLISDEMQLAGLPDINKQAAKALAKQRGMDGFCLDLSPPCYIAVMTYVEDRLLREEMYTAYVTRASAQGPFAKQWDNGPLMIDLLNYRREQAHLLGFNNYAEVSLATKMAESPAAVLDFLNALVQYCHDKALEEYCELQSFAAELDGIAELQAFDIPYYSEKLKQSQFDFQADKLRPYFPVEHVLQGFFSIVKRLYGISFVPLEHIDTWDDAVQVFALYDDAGQLRGHVYLDLFARPKKRGGAWMDEFRGRLQLADGSVQTPVAYVTCNFAAPLNGKPALLLHDEVVTLFHEFGHALQHLLTVITDRGAAGINGVAWDAVEFPSQFMEQWCWHAESLQQLSCHVETGEAIPDDLINQLIAARNFQSALQNLRQLEFALFDFRLHSEFNSQSVSDVQLFMQKIRDQVAVVRPPAYNRFQNSFTHIFSGGYAAGYYSYKWAEVLSCDAFGAFLEQGIFDRETGRRFLHTVLEQGGAQDPMDLFIQFRGRKPTIDALLQDNGIV